MFATATPEQVGLSSSRLAEPRAELPQSLADHGQLVARWLPSSSVGPSWARSPGLAGRRSDPRQPAGSGRAERAIPVDAPGERDDVLGGDRCRSDPAVRSRGESWADRYQGGLRRFRGPFAVDQHWTATVRRAVVPWPAPARRSCPPPEDRVISVRKEAMMRARTGWPTAELATSARRQGMTSPSSARHPEAPPCLQ